MRPLTAIKAATLVAGYVFKSVMTSRPFSLTEWPARIAGAWRIAWGAVSYDALAEKALANPYAARGLRIIGQLMSAVAVEVQTLDAEGNVAQTDARHPLARLFARPRPGMTRADFTDRILWHLSCGGELFLRRVAPKTGPNAGRPDAAGGYVEAISPREFSAFERDPRDESIITGFTFSRSFGRYRTYPAADILHVKLYNPADEERGLPLLTSAYRAMKQVEDMDAWNASVAQQRGRVDDYFVPSDGFLKHYPNGQIPKQIVDEAQARLDEKIEERRRSGLPMLLSGAHAPMNSRVTPRDADFLEARRDSLRLISAVLGIPAALLADEKGGSLTDAGVDSEVRAVYLLTVLPLFQRVLDEVNAWLAPLYGENVQLVMNTDEIRALQEDETKKVNRAVTLYRARLTTRNETRDSLGWERLPGEEHDALAEPPKLAAPPEQDDERPSGDGADVKHLGLRIARTYGPHVAGLLGVPETA